MAAMRVLACADLHGVAEVYEWLLRIAESEQPDGLLLAGDLLGIPGGFATVEEAQQANARSVVDRLAAVGCPIFFIMGNDDFVDVEPSAGSMRSVHERRMAFGGYNVVGYQHTLPFMGGINEKPESDIAADLRRLEDLVDEHSILLTHGPAHGILDSVELGGNAGSHALLGLIERHRPRAHIHGHIHHCFGRQGRHFNVASGGRKRAMLIDLESLTHRTVGDGDRRL
jgi:Icc-related predicted phosphoesterase